MPRTRQHQPAKAHGDQAYGVRGDQMSAQRMMPLPQSAPPRLNPAAMPTAQPPAPGGNAPVPPNAPDITALAAQARQGTPLTAPSRRPGEPVTAGLPIGPGPGREAQADMFALRRSMTAEALQAVADATGDTWLQDLADRARLMAR